MLSDLVEVMDVVATISWFGYLHLLQVFIVYPFPRLLFFFPVEIFLKITRGTGAAPSPSSRCITRTWDLEMQFTKGGDTAYEGRFWAILIWRGGVGEKILLSWGTDRPVMERRKSSVRTRRHFSRIRPRIHCKFSSSNYSVSAQLAYPSDTSF
jgi:hypothetical protein